MRISDWSSDVCSSDLHHGGNRPQQKLRRSGAFAPQRGAHYRLVPALRAGSRSRSARRWPEIGRATSELQSLMRISYAVFCLKKKTYTTTHTLHLPPNLTHFHSSYISLLLTHTKYELYHTNIY